MERDGFETDLETLDVVLSLSSWGHAVAHCEVAEVADGRDWVQGGLPSDTRHRSTRKSELDATMIKFNLTQVHNTMELETPPSRGVAAAVATVPVYKGLLSVEGRPCVPDRGADDGWVDAQLATSLDWLHSGPIRNSAGFQPFESWPPADFNMYLTHCVQLVETCPSIGGVLRHINAWAFPLVGQPNGRNSGLYYPVAVTERGYKKGGGFDWNELGINA
ncbi:hypothetical protein DFH06DRAFT_1152586 [Mycena polygramma]|nr:hypothetical protein DFH06DRAFT_1152586 [Mycena polygramma]